MADVDDDVKEFLSQVYEDLEQLDRDLVEIEKKTTDEKLLGQIFRTFHTIKGDCGFFGFSKLGSLVHAAESLLSRAREGEIRLNTDMISALLSVLDAVRQILHQIETTGKQGDDAFSEIKARLNHLAVNEISQESPHNEEQTISLAHETSGIYDSAIRVDVKQLDKLMTLVGELVLTRNQILQFTTEHTGLIGASQRLNIITSELQEGIMKARMQPIKKLWDKFPRLVRDLSVACGKKVQFKMEGEETELDKTLIETISNPMTHLVRNAIDHGLESPQERLAKGKTAEGHLFLHAFHESGKVNIEISDDGVGFNQELLQKNALQRGFITHEQAKGMTEKELFDLAFLPGFSTAQAISDISGRGVGLDVVKTNIDKIGGQIDIQSTPGEGTTFKFKLPLTLAIVPALIIKSGGDNYAIPQMNLVELVRLKGQRAKSIEWIHGAPIYRLRGKLLPLVYLNQVLKLEESIVTESINIVVVHTENNKFGLVVDEIKDTQEIVVKPLGKQLKNMPQYAGATILGNGHVALILDIMSLVNSENEKSVPETMDDKTKNQTEDAIAEMLLIWESTNKSRMAIPLSSVKRLEQFPRSKIEFSGNQPVIQYRDQILPLINISEVIEGNNKSSLNDETTEEMLQVVVHSAKDGDVGFIVPRVLDIVEERVTIKNPAYRRGVLYSTVIQGKVTELLDVETIINIFHPNCFLIQ